MRYTAVIVSLFLGLPSVIAVWEQCGGNNWTGSTVCSDGSICVKLNDWYSQCQPDGSSSISPTATISSSSSRTDTSVGTLPTSTSLGVRFKSKGKKYWGAFIRSATMSSSAGSLLKSQYNQITPRSSMTWGVIEPVLSICLKSLYLNNLLGSRYLQFRYSRHDYQLRTDERDACTRIHFCVALTVTQLGHLHL